MGFLRDTYRNELKRLEADLAAKKRVPPWKREPTQAERNQETPNAFYQNLIYQNPMRQQQAAQLLGWDGPRVYDRLVNP